MALPASGSIAISQISVELGRASTATTSLGETASRNLAGVASGAISMSNFYGKSNTFSFTISSHQDRANLRSLAVAAGWNQSSNVQATLASGVWIYSATTATPALTIDGSFPAGVTFINNGYVVGMGGNGGKGGDGVAAVGGSGGGTALALGAYVTIYNYGYIAGGGGGGGGGGTGLSGTYALAGGGGGGGGRTGLSNSSGALGGFSGGAYSGGTGGAGTSGSPGGGGAGGVSGTTRGGTGGTGGGWGATGGSGSNGTPAGAGAAGGAAGYCTSGGGYITWAVAGNRYGPLG